MDIEFQDWVLASVSFESSDLGLQELAGAWLLLLLLVVVVVVLLLLLLLLEVRFVPRRSLVRLVWLVGRFSVVGAAIAFRRPSVSGVVLVAVVAAVLLGVQLRTRRSKAILRLGCGVWGRRGTKPEIRRIAKKGRVVLVVVRRAAAAGGAEVRVRAEEG